MEENPGGPCTQCGLIGVHICLVAMNPAPREPSNAARQMGFATREVYLGMVEAGFSEAEAMRLTSDWLTTVTMGNTE